MKPKNEKQECDCDALKASALESYNVICKVLDTLLEQDAVHIFRHPQLVDALNQSANRLKRTLGPGGLGE